MRFWFHPLAEMELSEAVDYYEDVESGLGYDFSIVGIFGNPTCDGLSQGLGRSGRRYPAFDGPPISIWSFIF